MASKSRTHKREGEVAQILRRLKKNKAAMAGLYIFIFEIIVALLAPYIIPYDFAYADPIDRFMSPCAAHIFGTDSMGRDLFSRVLYGARYSLAIGVTATFLGNILGMAVGAIAGYFGGATDNAIMRTLDIIQAIPGMLLTVVIASVLGTGAVVTVIALAVGSIPSGARLFRASILNVRNQEYIEASRSIGCKTGRILLRHVVPNALSPMIVSTTMQVANSIVVCAALSFMGMGCQPPIPEWGALLNDGRNNMRMYPYLVIFPGAAIMLTVFCLNMLGDGLRDAMDPKLKD